MCMQIKRPRIRPFMPREPFFPFKGNVCVKVRKAILIMVALVLQLLLRGFDTLYEPEIN